MLRSSPLIGLLGAARRGLQRSHDSISPKDIYSTRRGALRSTIFRQEMSTRRNRTPYEVLGVSQSADDKEIKIAYFREAKKWHPDMNPGDATAKAKFQEIAAAYDILRDSSRRRQYDASAAFGGGSSNNQDWQNSSAAQGMDANDLFRSVQEDVEVIKDAFKMYISDIQEDFSYAVQAAGRQDWPEVWEVAKSNKGLIFGIVVPTLLVFRFPAAVFAVGRVAIFLAEGVFSALLMRGQIPMATRWLWRHIVKHAKDRKNRGK